MTQFGQVNTGTDFDRQLILPVQNFRKGVTAPADNLRGTTPSVPVITFANINELASIGITMPIDWDQGDFRMILEWALVNVQVNNDTLDIDVNYIAWEAPGSSNNILKTSTLLQPTVTVTTANGLAIGDVYRMNQNILAADANNPLGSATGFAFELNMTNTTSVAATDLISACLAYTALY